MAGVRQNRRFPWWLAFAAALVVVAAVIVLVRFPAPGPVTPAPAAASLELIPIGSGPGTVDSGEDISLRDPVPLYLPTLLNSGQSGALSDGGRREPVTAFQSFPAVLIFKENDPRVEFPLPIRLPESPVEALKTEQGPDAFGYFGRRGVELPVLKLRLGYLRVVKAESGAVAWEAELPPAEEAPVADWGPVEMVVAVNPAGLVGLPFVTTSSGSARFDNWVPGYLAGSYRLGERLHPGIYRISIGP